MEEANRRVVREIFAGHAARHAIPGLRATIDDWRQAETLAANFTALPDVATLVPLLTDHAHTAR
jgi:hypothetical protein